MNFTLESVKFISVKYNKLFSEACFQIVLTMVRSLLFQYNKTLTVKN